MKNDFYSKAPTSQIVLGLFVIAIGLLFLLDNLGILDMHRAFSFWPLAFIVVGTVKLCDTQTRGGQLIGGALISIGVLLMLDRMDVIDFSIRTVWPVLLIGFGAFTLYKAITGPRVAADGKSGHGTVGDSDIIDCIAIMGGFERRVTTPNFRGGEVTAVMGGCDLDMRNSSIQGEAVINVFAFWGGVTIKCPPDWTVVLQGTPIMGGFDEKTVAPPDGSKRLVIRGYAIMGGVEVRN
jgi:predicted membrane protein